MLYVGEMLCSSTNITKIMLINIHMFQLTVKGLMNKKKSPTKNVVKFNGVIILTFKFSAEKNKENRYLLFGEKYPFSYFLLILYSLYLIHSDKHHKDLCIVRVVKSDFIASLCL